MSEEKKEVQTKENAVQLPTVFNPGHIPTSHANIFRTRAINDTITLSYGYSYPDVATDNHGQKQPILAVDLERRIVMSVAAARRLLATLAQTIQQAEESKQA